MTYCTIYIFYNKHKLEYTFRKTLIKICHITLFTYLLTYLLKKGRYNAKNGDKMTLHNSKISINLNIHLERH